MMMSKYVLQFIVQSKQRHIDYTQESIADISENSYLYLAMHYTSFYKIIASLQQV